MPILTSRLGLALALAFASTAALQPAPAVAQSGSERSADPLIMESEGFLHAHPDLKHRRAGVIAYQKGDHERAMQEFRRAARFADKPSQGMIAELLWRGEGVPQNRVEAYAWMDLAAERHYRTMLIQREMYWAELDADERAAAIAFGEALYAEYGDKVAQPRLEKRMRRERARTTGSRTGFVGTLQIQLYGPAGPVTIDGASYYHPDYWEPERYWAWHDRTWKDPPRGVVDVGPLRSATGDAGVPPPADDGADRE